MSQKTIVVIDDSSTVRKHAELVLSPHGYTVYTADDGDTGLDIARKVMPSLILVDFIMPRMNGYKFCKVLRDDNTMKDIPIILITAKGDDVGQRFEEKFGIIHFFQKPFEARELIRKVNEVLVTKPEEVTEFEEVSQPEEVGEAEEVSESEKASKIEEVSELEEVGETEEISQSEEASEIEEVTEIARKKEERCYEEIEKLIEAKIERIMRNYFEKEFSVLLQSLLLDTLKQTDLFRTSNLIFSGQLGSISIEDILLFISKTQLTGKFSVFATGISSEVHMENGKVVFANTNKSGYQRFLADFVIEEGRITRKELNSALQIARDGKLPIGRVLVQEGYLSEEELMNYLKNVAEKSFQELLAVDAGNYYFEGSTLPLSLFDVKFRLPIHNLLQRKLDDKEVEI